MPFTSIVYQDPTDYALNFPPPAQAFVLKTIEAAEAAKMEELVQVALDEVVALNDLIAAEYPEQPNVQLSLADVTLAGGGDGHTFVVSLYFVPNDSNNVATLLGETMAPEEFRFRFAIASEDETLRGGQSAAIVSMVTIDGGDDALTLFQLMAGAAKGTRFMYLVGGKPEIQTPQ